MNRRITALMMALCMVLTAMPLHVHAEADHTHVWTDWTALGNGDHYRKCTVENCIESERENCYGGTATCKYQAHCEVCGYYHGELDPNNHQHPNGYGDPIDENTHRIKCSCGYEFVSSAPHNFDDWSEDGSGREYRYCADCYYRADREKPHTHSYSTATCATPATCACGETAGDVDKTNHVGGTEIRNGKDAAEFEAGYTGDTYCLGCGDKLADGQSIPATHVHSYATATCATPATCACGATMDSVDKTNHVGGTEIRNGKDAAEFEAGYTGDTYCLGCGDKLADGQSIPATHVHSYSIATCATPATCACGETTGDVDKTNHVGGTEIRNGKDAAEFEVGYTGDTYCLGCGDKLADGQSIPATHVHSYSIATCATPANCACGATMGGADKANHVGETEIRGVLPAEEFKPGYTGDEYCLSCGEVVEKGQEIPQTHRHIMSIADCVSTGGCICGYNYTPINPNEHLADRTIVNAKEATKTEHGYTGDEICSACKVVLTPGKVIHNVTIKSNTNGHWYECDISNCPDYDALKTRQENHSSEDNDGVCDICDKQFHWHKWSDTLEYDENAHYMRCLADNCFLDKEMYPQYAEHVAENVTYIDEDTHAFECSVCDYSGTSLHSEHDLMYADKLSHWYFCFGHPSLVLSVEDHDWSTGEDSPPTDETYCTVCGLKYDAIMNGCGHESFLYQRGDMYHRELCEECRLFVGTIEDHTFKMMSTDSSSHHEQCTGCGYARTESFKHGDWKIQNNQSEHWLQCGTCGYETYTEDHTYTDVNRKNGEIHRGYCSYCKAWFEDKHNFVRKAGSYDGAKCIMVCDICDATMNTSHHFELRSHALGHSMSCECGQVDGEFVRHTEEGLMVRGYDESAHFDYCSVCKYQTQSEPHTLEYRQVFLTTHEKYCRDCDYGYRETCIGSGDFLYDETWHWKECDDCGGKPHIEIPYHTDDNLDGKCDICRAEAGHAHSYEWTWINNEMHSGKCTVTVCNHIVNAQHVSGDQPGFCGDCGGEMAYASNQDNINVLISFTTDVTGGASSLENMPIPGNYGQLDKLFENVNFQPVPPDGDGSNDTPGAADALLGTVTGGEKDAYVGGAMISAGRRYSLYNGFSQLIEVNNGEDVPGMLLIQTNASGFEGRNGLQLIAAHDNSDVFNGINVNPQWLMSDSNSLIEETASMFTDQAKQIEFGYAEIVDDWIYAQFEVSSQSPFFVLVLVPEDS